MQLMSLEWATQRLINFHTAWRSQMVDVLRRLGLGSIREPVAVNHTMPQINLRRKLEADPARPRYLLSEQGVGYRLMDE